MLTSAHSIIEYDRGLARPDRLTRSTHAHYVNHARRMLDVHETGTGRTRRELHRDIEAVFANEPDCPVRRVAAFCKLLDDASVFDVDKRGAAAKLRLEVFGRAARFHPLVRISDGLYERSEAEVKSAIAAELGRGWPDIETSLYSDVTSAQRLLKFDGYPGPQALLARYNIAQIQAALYRAEKMSVWARDDFKTILRYAKLAGLLHEIHRVGRGDDSEYRIDLSGPASVLMQTRQYGVNMARFLPALLACRLWRLEALLRAPWGSAVKLKLSSDDGLSGHLERAAEFDSSVEEAFAKKFGAERDGWKLSREGVILHEGQTTFVPDFVFRHEDGREVLMEIVGFWTPEYLAKKREIIRRFSNHRIVLAVCKRLMRAGAAEGGDLIGYSTRLKVEKVMEALNRTEPQA